MMKLNKIFISLLFVFICKITFAQNAFKVNIKVLDSAASHFIATVKIDSIIFEFDESGRITNVRLENNDVF